MDNYKKVKQVLWIILFANFAVALLKIIIGNKIKSYSMTADGFHSLSDGASNIVGLIGIFFASKPKDKDHPYGHKKFEIITSLFISGMLFVIAVKIILSSISRLANPVTPSITIESLIALVITLFINIFVCIYEYRVGTKLNSYVLISDSLHTRSDIFVSLGVLVTLVGVKLGFPVIIESVVPIIISGFIIYSAYGIFKPSIGILVDRVAVDEEYIREIVFEFNEVRDVHNIRSRGSKSVIYIDMHVMVDPFISVEQSHDLTHKIEKQIQEEINENAQVIVHIEPFYSF
ncbi:MULTISPECIES: cation diffusion facilitator family transporter [unclassified Clostridioides]|uniref:cation diffusion facilitator family transporter n=1 Tax=unclassified Clostridioides TaxID=2635829 RepID=UPI001D0C0C55|nr:cation transporter [Clostridioides sp. ES-S-0001-02]MCC0641663.1 cation transporter [Clostridioides sp. ES-S-0049-03]MCC0653175.1 cation transporter [Clostridioides sp. ES-S-0001-03]MCC0656818.1 cation transporter [Clostridioides sp. ES-S-0123-01]MCC0673450.1 cation transporter [Clostridioides sp. ES-S-0145-01]MCC0676196.1 cation transporter [Clostridioides sp. ES-W-0018-02]MCC0681528.1 cation transporter [Clostridioides sp. ES-S-0005-03]MCC0696817.1 cation transporter [Clostridioides sp.